VRRAHQCAAHNINSVNARYATAVCGSVSDRFQAALNTPYASSTCTQYTNSDVWPNNTTGLHRCAVDLDIHNHAPASPRIMIPVLIRK